VSGECGRGRTMGGKGRDRGREGEEWKRERKKREEKIREYKGKWNKRRLSKVIFRMEGEIGNNKLKNRDKNK
jgi:hypothetical protein